MIARTYPYGTRIVVNVLSVDRTAKHQVFVVQHIDHPTEATVLILGWDQVATLYLRPKVGEIRLIEFREGGPTGGHWMFLDGLDVTRANKTTSEGSK